MHHLHSVTVQQAAQAAQAAQAELDVLPVRLPLNVTVVPVQEVQQVEAT